MTELTDEFDEFIHKANVRDWMYAEEMILLEKVLARLVKAEEDLENCSEIISKAEF